MPLVTLRNRFKNLGGSGSWLLVASCLTLGAASPGSVDPALARFAEVDAVPVKTSIYIGTVTLVPGPFLRSQNGQFSATYAAKVFPYFFANEAGRMYIDVPDDALRQIAAGQAIHFRGKAVRTDGTVRSIEGSATPTSASEGKLQVKIHVSRRITLSFGTTYRLPAVH
ncbi:MAG TPA: hypothetical protein VGL42_16210 [Opitutaceae bacterium]|jgi:hypothetical protein